MKDVQDPHRQAYAYCAYCPKICRFSCPVSEVTKNETTSPWGKMTEAYLVAGEKRQLEESGARALHACTGCMRCRSFCDHQNEVGYALFSSRQKSLEQELSPRGVNTTRATFAEHQNPFGKDLSKAVAAFPVDAPVRYALFPGCSSLAKRTESIENALFVGEALSTPLGVSKASSRCCGYPLYAAGDLDGFRAQAERMRDSLADLQELVVQDPGCAYTMKVVYPRVGVELKTEVMTIYEVFAERIDSATQPPPLELKTAYHDACHLGRGLGQYDAPRKLLSAAVGVFREAHEIREEAGCSGGGGLVPRSMPEVSVEMARKQAERLAPGDETIVTACTTSRRMFERAGRSSQELLGVLRRWLTQPPRE